LTKSFGSVLAVDHLDLTVSSGEIFGFLGPNGAGKTTTIKMMTGLLQPTEGRVLLDGHDIQTDPLAAKTVFGLVTDQPYVYEKLTAREFLRFIAELRRIPAEQAEKRIDDLLDLFELREWQDEMLESYSHGMKQKTVLSAAILHEPRVLIVDEPMVGLDPKSARLLKDLFRGLSRKGVAIFMSTHTLEIAEKVCDRIGIIQHGRLISAGTMAELRALSAGSREHLEDLFLELTGGEAVHELVRVLGDPL
jgi:ABC-2 type transport system ATP-binding protein